MQNAILCWVLWFKPVILATQEEGIRKTEVRDQSKQKSSQALISNNGWAQ
jgi:hypothetical protein